VSDYDPVTGENWDREQAARLWGESMNRSALRWSLCGRKPTEFYWTFFAFRSYTGRVTVEADGFHWETQAYDNRAGDEVYHEGVTTSLFEAYQSVEQNRPVTHEEAGHGKTAK